MCLCGEAPQELRFTTFYNPLIVTSGPCYSHRINLEAKARTGGHSEIHPLPDSLHQTLPSQEVSIRNQTIVLGEH